MGPIADNIELFANRLVSNRSLTDEQKKVILKRAIADLCNLLDSDVRQTANAMIEKVLIPQVSRK